MDGVGERECGMAHFDLIRSFAYCEGFESLPPFSPSTKLAKPTTKVDRKVKLDEHGGDRVRGNLVLGG